MDAETIKRKVDILGLIGSATELKKVASSEGGEWAGACPFCGGEDRFRVQPNHPDGGRWYCRGCGNNKWHDAIDYIALRDGVDFMGAMETLEGPQEKTVIAAPVKPAADPSKWGDAAYQFVEDSASCLWTDEGKAALEYLHGRGLNDDTLRYWAIGFNPLEGYGSPREWGVEEKVFLPRGIIIPCWKHSLADIVYVKVRRSSGEPRYQQVKGSKQWLFGGFTYIDQGVGFLFESELDVLLAWQTGLSCGYAAMPAGQKIHDEYFQYFKDIDYLIVAYDNDAPGQDAADKIVRRSRQFYFAHPLPAGKDLTEYYQTTRNLDDVTEWLYAQLEWLPHG